MSDGEEIVPLKSDDREGKNAWRNLVRFIRTTRKFQGRINTLRLWTEAIGPTGKVHKKIAEVEYDDHPQVQLILERRDRYNELREDIEKQKELAADPGLDTELRCKLFESINAMTTRADKELIAIELVMAQIRREWTEAAKTILKMLEAAAKLKLMQRMHEDKIELAKQKDPGSLSTAELLKVLETDDAT